MLNWYQIADLALVGRWDEAIQAARETCKAGHTGRFLTPEEGTTMLQALVLMSDAVHHRHQHENRVLPPDL